MATWPLGTCWLPQLGRGHGGGSKQSRFPVRASYVTQFNKNEAARPGLCHRAEGSAGHSASSKALQTLLHEAGRARTGKTVRHACIRRGRTWVNHLLTLENEHVYRECARREDGRGGLKRVEDEQQQLSTDNVLVTVLPSSADCLLNKPGLYHRWLFPGKLMAHCLFSKALYFLGRKFKKKKRGRKKKEK